MSIFGMILIAIAFSVVLYVVDYLDQRRIKKVLDEAIRRHEEIFHSEYSSYD